MTEPFKQPSAGSTVVCRNPGPADAAAVHALVDECKPLDLNSTYAYLLLCTHFADTCVVAELEGRVVGFLSAYRKPQDDSVLFVWQVAVSPTVRGRGTGKQMLEQVFRQCRWARFIETTIGPDNKASWALFESFARKHSAPSKQETLFAPEDFGAESHEEERLLRIGPLQAFQEETSS
jgi:L-2,4-diaminobutyric acid acetyltransferase